MVGAGEVEGSSTDLIRYGGVILPTDTNDISCVCLMYVYVCVCLCCVCACLCVCVCRIVLIVGKTETPNEKAKKGKGKGKRTNFASLSKEATSPMERPNKRITSFLSHLFLSQICSGVWLSVGARSSWFGRRAAIEMVKTIPRLTPLH